MECPNCHKDTCVLVTTEAKGKVKERRGIFWRIVLFPYYLVRWVWRLLFGRKKQTYYKKQHWHCNYCNNDFDQKFEEN